MTSLVTGAAGFIGSRRARCAATNRMPLLVPGSLLLQGLRPRTPVRTDSTGGDLGSP